jgi:hypothetical protein
MLANQPLVSALPKQGYWARPAPPGTPGPRHSLGGTEVPEGATCPNCRRPLLLIMSLDATDRRLELDRYRFKLLPLLYCWTCVASAGLVRYALEQDGSAISILEFPSGDRYTDFPYPDYPAHFERHALTLVPLTPEEQRVLYQLNRTRARAELFEKYPALDRPRHQVGGEPLLLQSAEELTCSRCSGDMPLLASIGNDALGPKTFTDNDWVQLIFHICPQCSEVAAYTATD